MLAREVHTACWPLLDYANLVQYIHGRVRLDKCPVDIEDGLMLYLRTTECVEMFQCKQLWGMCWQQFLLEGSGQVRLFDPLHTRFLHYYCPVHILHGNHR